jgi:hypothetical protein
MTDSPLYKRAFVRGLNAELIRQGVVVYPSKEAADQTADFIADESGMPDPQSQGERLDIKVASALVDFLIRGADEQCKAVGNKYNPQLSKTAAAQDPAECAYADSISLMEKCAAESEENTLAAAAKNSDAAERELRERPEGYAHTGPGNYEGKGEAPQGKEREPTAPGTENSKKVPGTNSVIENSKTSALQDIVRRVAKTAGNDIGDHGPNDMPSAAENSDALRNEMEARPEGYANYDGAMGNTEMSIPADAQIGEEEEHPDVQSTPETSGTNSVIDAVGGVKSAFDQLFENTARQLIPYLPAKMDENQKVAHVRRAMGLDVAERAGYLGSLYLKLGADQASAKSVHDHFMKKASDDEEATKRERKEENEDKKPAGESADRPKDEQAGKSVELPSFMTNDKKEASAKPRPAQGSLTNIRERLRSLHA